jgi:RNA polymerase sigma-70 factor (ECF subfamily)
MQLGQFGNLLEEARSGIDAAWSEIYRDLAPPVLGYLRANGSPDPEDVLGEVFLQIARDLPGFDGDERKFRAWIFAIAHHRMIDARRHRARRPVDLMAEPPEAIGAVAADAATEALTSIDNEETRRIFDRLSPDQRAVLLLRVLGELTVDEVATVLDKRPGAVKALQRRGLAAVQRELTERGVPL